MKPRAVMRMAVIVPVLLLLAGCGDTWNRFTTPDFSWSRDRSVSADRAPARAADGWAPMAASPLQSPVPAARSSAAASRALTRTAAQSGCYLGRLTEEGNTCQAMRTNGGDLLTLAGPLRGFGSGDAVCVCGIPASQQFCGQGLTLLIREISNTCADIQ